MTDQPNDEAAPNTGDSDLVRLGQTWRSEIDRAQKYFDRYFKRCAKIEKIYTESRDDASANQNRNYAMLWANTQVMQPAVYARTPQPVVSRRYKDDDPVGRVASEMLERAISFEMDRAAIDEHFRDIRDDFLLFARGTSWVRYEAEFEEYEADDASGPETAQDGAEQNDTDASPLERIAGERVCVEYVHWSDFLHEPARRWQDVGWVARRVYLDGDEIKERFGEEAASRAAEVKQTSGQSDTQRAQEHGKTAIWEIWDRKGRQCVWMPDQGTFALEAGDPPLDLSGFFPCPRPAYGTLSTSSLLPVPDFVFYQGQQQEIDALTKRIAKLTDQLALKGFYPAGEGDVTRALEAALKPGNDTIMVPVPSWAAFTEKGGGNAVVWLPVDQVQKTIAALVEVRKQLIDDIYQITGISDIVRGESQASETATAQQIKSQWGSLRIRDRQAELARYARDVVAMTGEVIAELFQPETLLAMTNMQLMTDAAKQQFQLQQQIAQQQYQRTAQIAQVHGMPAPPPPQVQPPAGFDQPSIDQVMQVLRDDILRLFKLDIETDSTVEPDENAEKQRRIEFMQGIGGFIQNALPALQAQPGLVPFFGETILWVARGFRAGRELEDTLEKAIQQVTQQAMAPKPPPQPSPDEQVKMEATKVKANAEIAKAKMAVQGAAMDHAHAVQAHHMDMQKLAVQAAQPVPMVTQ
ncbi:MAG TPA: hypothetical protein VN112_16285 [Ensifer sp.]|nr:hypothetical protein [Ensifer sp.]